LVQKQQQDRREHRLVSVMDKKEDVMKQTLENMKKQVTSKKGGRDKKAKQIASYKKKMDKMLGDNDYEGLPMTSSMPRRAAKWKRPEGEPDKAIQFSFRNCSSKWNEPLILAMEVGYKSDENQDQDHSEDQKEKQTPGSTILFDENGVPIITKKDGFLFDCIDLCINEGEKYCILGENVSAETSILLKILAKVIQPTEGVVHTVNVDIAYLDSDKILSILDGSGTPLSYLTETFTQKTEHEIRAELTAFGLNPKQASTDLRFLSGGERCRLCLAEIMLRNPHVICLDQPTANLDLESVDALIYGLKKWDGTVIMVSHDAYFLRSLEVKLYALIAEEGKLRRVEGGIEAYLRSFAKSA
jgi:ATPase subunit of ABC transporter with duplicated ATPase domains